MAIPDNYIDKITKGNDSRMISPAADMVRVDNDNFDGETLDEVLTEIAEAGSGGYTPPAGGIPKSDLAQSVQDTLDDVDNKVDKETGKGLSTNDYTTAEKTKLAGIAAGAEVNVQPNWTQTNTSADDYIKNKPTIPSKTSELTNDAGYTNNTGTVTGISVNGGTTQLPTNGVVNLTIGTGGPNDIVDVTTTQQGTIIFTKRSGDTVTVDLNHVHEQYLKYELLADEAAYNALATKDSSTLYLIPEA